MNLFANLLPKPVALACAGAVLLLTTAAQAQENNPYYVGATLRSTYNSNVTTEAVAKRDTINSAGLKVGLDQSLGRQRLVLDLSANHNRFNRYTQFNHTDYSATGQLNWETIENLSGTFSAGTRQSRLVDSSTQQSQLNLLHSHNVNLQARLGEVTALTFEAGLAASQNRYSAQNYRQNDLNQLAVDGGVRLRPMGGVSLRLGARHTAGSYPNYVGGEDSVSRNDLDLSASARLTGASQIGSRLSLTRENHSAVRGRDFHGWTGALNWNWQPTGKLKIKLDMNRDSNVGATDYQVGNVRVQVNDGSGVPGYQLSPIMMNSNESRISNKLGLVADWEMSAMLSLNAGWSETWRTLDNAYVLSQNPVGSASARDRTALYSLGLRYVPLQSIELGCSLSITQRTVSENASGLTYPYKQTVTSCYGTLQLN